MISFIDSCSKTKDGNKIPSFLYKKSGFSHIKRKIKEEIYMDSYPEFSKNRITIDEAAALLGKEKVFIREGIKDGRLPIGTAYKKPGSSRYSYYISPKLFWEYTGIIV